MRLNVWLLVLLVTFCVLLATAAPSENAERNGNKKGGVHKNKGEGKGGKNRGNEVEKGNKKGNKKKDGNKNSKCNATPVPAEKSCHSEAVRKCGRNFINKLQKQEGPDGKVPYKEKCQLRETFLNCVTENRLKHCRSRGRAVKPSQREDMKRVAKYLWSTRGCLLGVDSP